MYGGIEGVIKWPFDDDELKSIISICIVLKGYLKNNKHGCEDIIYCLGLSSWLYQVATGKLSACAVCCHFRLFAVNSEQSL